MSTSTRIPFLVLAINALGQQTLAQQTPNFRENSPSPWPEGSPECPCLSNASNAALVQQIQLLNIAGANASTTNQPSYFARGFSTPKDYGLLGCRRYDAAYCTGTPSQYSDGCNANWCWVDPAMCNVDAAACIAAVAGATSFAVPSLGN